ncbi:hypothetical protein KIN20_001445 [Parelaphostrongylus tenuis]|uniref:Uncharacterized protein n=1 Tax=Parelaphostrongylus tenuis TaxID=148309 RepID=A0AAD5MCU1_PARTN|nr:hypothetical protein KIN20_001445 [Parelaphostrongylus tenuis]
MEQTKYVRNNYNKEINSDDERDIQVERKHDLHRRITQNPIGRCNETDILPYISDDIDDGDDGDGDDNGDDDDYPK